MKSFFFALGFLLSVYSANSQWNEKLFQAERQLFALNLDQAHKLVNQEKSLNPKNPVSIYLDASITFLQAIAIDTEDQHKYCIDNLDKSIKLLESIQGHEELKLHFLGELYALRGTLKERMGNNVRSALDFYSSYKKLKSGKDKFPENPVYQMYWGAILAGIGSLPPNYQSYLRWVGFKGDIDEGLDKLEKSVDAILAQPKLKYYHKRAAINYAMAYHRLTTDKNLKLENKGVQVMGVPLFELGMAKIAFEQNRAAEAVKYLDSYAKHQNIIRFHYYYYLRAKVQLVAGHPQADEMFFEYLKNYSGQNFIKASHRYLAWFYLINNNLEKSKWHKSWAIEKGQTLVWSDKAALKDAQATFNRTLILARLKYDGGYYQEALKSLREGEKNCCPSADEQTEWAYRMGRVYQAMNHNKQASLYYKKALDGYENIDFNVGNSCLQIAIIAEQAGDAEKAEQYYKKCLTLSGFNYQEEVHQKAKAGLVRLKR